MQIVKLNRANPKNTVAKAEQILTKGGLVIFPSDTVYGLLVDATNDEAVKKLIAFKSRPPGKAISVFVDFEMVDKYVDVGTIHELSLRKILPGPFTIILPSKHRVSKLLESEKGTLGIRIPDYVFINRLINMFKKPITATSANLSGRSAHYSIKTLMSELSDKKKKLIDLIIDAGKLPRNKPSTVIDLTAPTVKTLRKGDIIFKDKKTYISDSPSQTQKIAQYILRKFLAQEKHDPIIFIIEGELGVGKTIFVKGIGEALGINNIISPTYVVSYEYAIKNSNFEFRISKLIHYDLYNIQDPEELNYLGIEKSLKKGNVLCFEWGEKSGEIVEVLKKGKIIRVRMKYINENEREIIINF